MSGNELSANLSALRITTEIFRSAMIRAGANGRRSTSYVASGDSGHDQQALRETISSSLQQISQPDGDIHTAFFVMDLVRSFQGQREIGVERDQFILKRRAGTEAVLKSLDVGQTAMMRGLLTLYDEYLEEEEKSSDGNYPATQFCVTIQQILELLPQAPSEA